MLRKVFSRLTHFFDYVLHRHDVENGLQDERRSGFEMMAERHVKSGMSLAEARGLTRIEFDGLDSERKKRPIEGTLADWASS
ncbi:MAG TPA: hypothetical protein VHZ55_09150 [Bryobacteraceae bacterium]|jgi:hypothetical protein|nr:hypothetical protein [Bryobacteraceae bacterium]